MGVYQCEVETYLLFCQRRLHIGDAQRFGEQFGVIQLVYILVIMHGTFYVAQLLIIGQRIHRFELDSHVTVLHTAAIVALITLFHFRIIRNHNLAVIIHILVGLLTGFAVILSGVAVRIIRHILVIAAGCHAVALVELHLHKLELILLGSLAVTNLLAGLGTMVVTRREVGILFYHFGVVADSAAVIARLCTQQTTVESCHHIVRLHLQHKVEIFYRTVIVTYLCTQQSPVIVTEEVIGVNIQRQVIVAHRTSQVILMETRQSPVYVVARITCAQVYRLVQILFSFLVVGLLKTDNGTGGPAVGVVTVHINGLIKILQGLYRIVLLEIDLTAHQVRTRIAGSYGEQLAQILFGSIEILFLHMTKREVMPKYNILRVVLQSRLVVLDRTVELILADTCQTSYLISAYNKRIALNSLIAIRSYK